MLKKLLTNTLLFGLAPYIPKIVSVLLLPILTKYLTATDYGIAGTIDAYTQALTALSTLGFSSVLNVSFFRSKCQYKILWREIYGFLQFWMIVFSLIQGLVLYCIIPQEAIDNRWLIILLTNFSNVFFGPTAMIGNAYYVLQMKPIPIVSRSIISGLITVCANYIFVVHYQVGYLGWYISSFIGTFIINASYWYDVNVKLGLKPILKFKQKTIIRYLKVSVPTIPHYYSAYLMNSSSKMVMNLQSVSLSIIGQTNLVLQIGGLMDSWVSAINQAINPMTMRKIRNNDENSAKRLIYVYIIITLSCTMFFSLWSKEIFGLLISNKELATTYPYVILFVMALNYRPMYVAASNIFFYYEKTLPLLRITLTSGAIAFIAYLVLIPIFKIWGVMIGFYISAIYMGYSGFCIHFFKSKTKVHYPVFKILAIQVLSTILVFVLVDINFIYKLIISISIIAILFYLIYKKRIIYVRSI